MSWAGTIHKVKLVNKYTTTRKNQDSTSGIYLTNVKVSQCRQLAKNRRKRMRQKGNSKEDSHKNVHLQLKRSEAFDMRINYINSLYQSTTDKERFIQIIQQYSNIIKDSFVYIGVKLIKIPNQRINTVAIYMIQILKLIATIK